MAQQNRSDHKPGQAALQATWILPTPIPSTSKGHKHLWGWNWLKTLGTACFVLISFPAMLVKTHSPARLRKHLSPQLLRGWERNLTAPKGFSSHSRGSLHCFPATQSEKRGLLKKKLSLYRFREERVRFCVFVGFPSLAWHQYESRGLSR